MRSVPVVKRVYALKRFNKEHNTLTHDLEAVGTERQCYRGRLGAEQATEYPLRDGFLCVIVSKFHMYKYILTLMFDLRSISE
jgi:hypothetical protein